MIGIGARLAVTILVAASLAGCGKSEERIAEMTRTSMQETLAMYAPFQDRDLEVTAVQVVGREGNRYRGIAHVDHGGTTHEVPVEMTVDGASVLWKTEPSAWVFARTTAEGAGGFAESIHRRPED